MPVHRVPGLLEVFPLLGLPELELELVLLLERPVQLLELQQGLLPGLLRQELQPRDYY